MSLLPPSMRGTEPAPLALGPAIRKPQEPTADEQRLAQVQAFERGDHQLDGSVLPTFDIVWGRSIEAAKRCTAKALEDERQNKLRVVRSLLADLIGMESGEKWPDDVYAVLQRLEQGVYADEMELRRIESTRNRLRRALFEHMVDSMNFSGVYFAESMALWERYNNEELRGGVCAVTDGDVVIHNTGAGGVAMGGGRDASGQRPPHKP